MSDRIETEAFSVNKTDQTRKKASIKREIETLQQRIEKARNMMLNDKIDASDFRAVKEAVLPKIDELNRKLNTLKSSDGDCRTFIEHGFGILKNIAETYSHADL